MPIRIDPEQVDVRLVPRSVRIEAKTGRIK
jgi:hypothetical protein